MRADCSFNYFLPYTISYDQYDQNKFLTGRKKYCLNSLENAMKVIDSTPPTHNCYLVEQCGVIPCGDTPVKHHVSFGISLWRHFISINVLLRGV